MNEGVLLIYWSKRKDSSQCNDIIAIIGRKGGKSMKELLQKGFRSSRSQKRSSQRGGKESRYQRRKA